MLRSGKVLAWGALVLGVAACDDARGAGRGDAGFDGAPDAALDAPSEADQSETAPPTEGGPVVLAAPCNGASALCDQAFSSLVFLGSHSSLATDATWTPQTQGRALRDQLLVGGVRALELEVHDDGGALTVCEGSCQSGSQSVSAVLREVSTFLTGNPREILTLVLRSAVAPAALAGAFDTAGLTALAHSQAAGTPWPTLQEMIDANERLVVFVDPLDAADAGSNAGQEPDASADSPPWLHLLQAWAWETAPNEGIGCSLARGNASGELAILNHYVPGEAADAPGLSAAHTPEVIAARLQRCSDDHGHVPNIVFVDFAELGDPNGGPQIANGLR